LTERLSNRIQWPHQRRNSQLNPLMNVLARNKIISQTSKLWIVEFN